MFCYSFNILLITKTDNVQVRLKQYYKITYLLTRLTDAIISKSGLCDLYFWGFPSSSGLLEHLYNLSVGCKNLAKLLPVLINVIN